MNAQCKCSAIAPGLAAPEGPEKGEACGVLAEACKDQGKANSGDLRSAASSGHTLRVIEGEQYALAYLDRLRAGMASPDDLVVLMSFLHGEMLAGACRVIEKAMGVRHG